MTRRGPTDEDAEDTDAEDTRPTYDPRFADARRKVTKAFEALRLAGFIARERFMCCAGCALSSLTTDIDGMKKKDRKNVRGVVFYHEQDDEAFHRNGRRINLYVRFTESETDDKRQSDNAMIEVGAAAVAAFEATGLTVLWDRKATSCIEVVIR